jgi:hypothetical protein
MKVKYEFYPRGPEDWDWMKVYEDGRLERCPSGCLPNNVALEGYVEGTWIEDMK